MEARHEYKSHGERRVMHKRIRGHLYSLLWAMIGLVVLGLLIGELASVLAIGLLSYMAWTVWQAIKLHRWLYSIREDQAIPESHGLWGDLFDGLYQIQYQNRLTQENLRSMINRVQLSTNALKEAVVMTNSEGEMDWWNESASKLLGFKRESDRGQLITNLLRDPSFKRYFESKNYNEPLEVRSPLNKSITLQVHITLFGEDDRLVFAQDITRVQRLEQMRRDFVSNVSHDMRTPLTVIRGYIETFQDSDDTPKKWRRALNSMQQQTLRMEGLISDLLLLAKYETEGLADKTTSIDIAPILQEVYRDAKTYSADRKHDISLKFETSQPCFFTGDAKQLYSAFSNLVFNAVKYTPAGGHIDMSWWLDEDGAHFAVRDTGDGFDSVHIPHLTERFYRTDPSRDNASGGSGLGLAIVKHVLINHNAELEIHSEVGIGSEFICHFPTAMLLSNAAANEQSALNKAEHSS
jgi:two-component system phosphate regulon sensor histidine kinase PhoR